jgi:cell division topological specificity factor
MARSFLSSLLFWHNKQSANVAKQRLQALLAAERAQRPVRRPDYLPALQKELVGVLSKYVKVPQKDIRISLELDRQQAEVLRVKVVLSPAGRG